MTQTMELPRLPRVIQGGMGIGVSGYRLARAVSEHGGLGVVSGTAIDTVFVRRLADAATAMETERALARFPYPRLAAEFAGRYRGRSGPKGARYRLLSLPGMRLDFERQLVLVLAAFVEVSLAKEGHEAPVGMNLLEKIQLPTLPTLFGALLARLDVLLMGAGVPSAIPGVLDRMATLEDVSLALHVEGAKNPREFLTEFSAGAFVRECEERERHLGGVPGEVSALPRPLFLAIVSSEILAKRLLKVASGRIDGFVVEHHSAGGHNAPPRRPDEQGRHTDLDEPKLDVFRALGVPFWLAGSLATPEALARAGSLGASGVQVGTAFAFCEESGITRDLKDRVLRGVRRGTIRVETDLRASPTGYPFKVVVDEETPGERQAQRDRCRVCDLGYLRQAYVDEDGALGFRCPGEPPETFLKKGGDPKLIDGKLCLCNQLLATVGLGQSRGKESELALLTAGAELSQVLAFSASGTLHYSARDVLDRLLRLPPEPPDAFGAAPRSALPS